MGRSRLLSGFPLFEQFLWWGFFRKTCGPRQRNALTLIHRAGAGSSGIPAGSAAAWVRKVHSTACPAYGKSCQLFLQRRGLTFRTFRNSRGMDKQFKLMRTSLALIRKNRHRFWTSFSTKWYFYYRRECKKRTMDAGEGTGLRA